MAPSTVFLIDCSDPENARDVPFSMVDTYTKLEDETPKIFGREDLHPRVSFHFSNRLCKFTIVDNAYNGGHYFANPYVIGNSLRLRVHFQPDMRSPSPRPIPFVPTRSSRRSEIGFQHQNPRGSPSSSDLASLRQLGRPAEDQSEVDFDSGGATPAVDQIDHNTVRAARMFIPKGPRHPIRRRAVYDPKIHGPPMLGLNADDFFTDLQDAKVIGTHDQAEHANPYPNNRAHALLINGAYGIVASKPCARCISLNIPCCLYHPQVANLKVPGQFNFGTACGGCRQSPEHNCCDAEY